MAELIGQSLGKYQLTEMLGRGGMATVYRARQIDLERDVAVKVLSGALGDQKDFMARFQREALTVARLEHDRIVPVYDFGEDRGYFYLAMRLLNRSLADLMNDGPLSIEQTNHFVQQICSALQYAHNNDVIHRDLKPSNILLDEFDNAYLMDFGIAKLTTGVSLTKTGAVLGTPAYMAPEVWHAAQIGVETDLYALGVTIFQMLSGNLPFEAPTPPALMMRHLNDAPPILVGTVPGLSEAAQLVVHRLLEKEPGDRYSNANDVADAFMKATLVASQESTERRIPVSRLTGTPTTPVPSVTGATSQDMTDATEILHRPPEQKGSRGLLMLAVLALIVIVGGIVGLVVIGGGGEEDEPAPTQLAADEETATVEPTTEEAVNIPTRIVTSAPPPTIADSNLPPTIVTSAPPPTVADVAAAPTSIQNTATTPPSDTPAPQQPGLRVEVSTGIIYEEPDTNSGQVRQAPEGSTLTVIGISPDSRWYQVEFLGDSGWVFADQVALQNISTDDIAVVLTETPLPTETASPTPTDTPTPTETPSPSLTPSDTPTATLIPTDTPTITPTAVLFGLPGAVTVEQAVGPSVILVGGSVGLNTVAWSPDGSTLAAADVNGEIMIFQGTDSVIPALTWTAHDGPINSVAWSPDGSLLASGGDDLSVGVWVPTTGEEIPDIFTSHFEPIEAVTWRPDGLQLSTAGADGRLLRWNVTNNYERLAPLETNVILTADWNPDSSQIVVGGPDRVVRVLDAQFGGAIPLGQHRDIIRAVDWSEDGSQVGAVSDDGDVILWNADGSGEFTLARRLVGSTSLQISRDSRRIAVSYGQEIRIWDTESYILIALLRVDPGLTLQDVTWNADGTQIAAAASNGTIQVWDVPQEAPQRVSVGTPLQAHQGAINQLEWDANGERVATIGVDMALNIWDARSGVQLATLSGGHTADVISVAWSPDQRRIATGSCDNTIVLWDITSGSQIQSLEGHRGCVTNLMFTADSQILLSVDATGIIRGWNLVSYESAITPQAAHPDTVNDMIFTPDRDLFATAGQDGSVRTWALSGGNLQVVSRNQQDNMPLTSVDWGIDTIMVGNTEGILRVYPYPFESTTRDELEGHTAGISGVRFSPVRQRIASIDSSGCVFLWDTAFAEKLLQRCEISAVEYRALAWSPRGDAFAIGNERGELIFWLAP